MSRAEFDLVVIGTGPAASTVARQASEQSRRVAIIEARPYGGTCALRGCNPKKVFVNAAMLMAQVRGGAGKLISAPNACIQWPELVAFKREFTDSIPENSESSFREAGIETFHGTARFVGPEEVCVGERILTANRFVIGTGAQPAKLGIPGEEYLVHSDQFMELETIPPRVIFIGGGYISLEFAHVVAQYGSEVIVLESNDRILEAFDPDLTRQLANWSQAQGIQILTSAEARRILRTDENGFEVVFRHKGREERRNCDLVVHGAGRTPNLRDLNLDVAGVAWCDRGITVDRYLRSTTSLKVFACGDCADTSQPKLTPTANEEARAVSKNVFAEDPSYAPDYGVIPRVAFTVPPIAAVGMPPAETEKFESDGVVRTDDTSSWNSVRKSGLTCGGYKLILDKSTDRILGAHLLGPGADETINLFALAMKFQLTATDLKSTLFAFPTFASDVRQMV